MIDIRVEPLVSLADLDALMAVEQASFISPWTREMYLAELANPEVSSFVLARSAGEVVGFCSFWRVLDELHINNLAVLPDRRREGIGALLLVYVLRDGAARGAVRAMLEVRRLNDAARALYERFGFAVAGLRRGYYANPVEDALLLRHDGLEPG